MPVSRLIARMPERVLALVAGTLLFAVAFPWMVIQLGDWLMGGRRLCTPRRLELAIGLPSTIGGLLLAGRAAVTQVRIGRGTPVHAVPTRRLITSGPYRLCRNPMMLGTTIFYLGMSTLIRSLAVGLFSMLAAGIPARLYHHLVEENELAERFGEEYEPYRQRTPFLVPRPRWR